MHPLILPAKRDGKLSILCLGAHSDDIEIGCGGTILRLLEGREGVTVWWVVFSHSSQPDRAREARASAETFLQEVEKKIVIRNYRDGYFPFIGDQVKDSFEQLKSEIEPDLIFTHYRNDLHQDHRLISNLTWNTFRDHLILEYEIPKYDGDLGSPNFYVPLSESVCNNKIGYLLRHFHTQKQKHWFTSDTFFSLLRIRGLECNSPSKYAEAFYSHKMVI